MSVFTPAEIEYLNGRTMCRMATVGRDGRPHLIPIVYRYNPDEDTIDIGGMWFTNAKKWRDVQHDQRVTVIMDDASPEGAHSIEIRADAEIHLTGGESINPRFPNYSPEFIRLRPRYVVSWGIEEEGFKPFGRRVA